MPTTSRAEDRRLLETLINTYHWRVDHFDWAGWGECFTEDAVFDMPDSFGRMAGRVEIRDTCRDNTGGAYKALQHVIVNLALEFTGPDTANGHGNLLFTAVPDPARPANYHQAGGRYTWEFRRTADGWRISRARLDLLWNTFAGTAIAQPE